MVTANSVKFSSISCKIFPSNTSKPSRSTFDVWCSKLAFWASTSTSTRLREYDNILCPSLCWNDLSSQAPHKSSPKKFTRRLQDDLQILPRTHTICFDACPPAREITWCDVTSEKGKNQNWSRWIRIAWSTVSKAAGRSCSKSTTVRRFPTSINSYIGTLTNRSFNLVPRVSHLCLLSRWNRDPGCGWSRDHQESGW